MRDADIVTLYKNKGGHCNCKNYQGTSFLSIIGKLFALFYTDYGFFSHSVASALRGQLLT